MGAQYISVSLPSVTHLYNNYTANEGPSVFLECLVSPSKHAHTHKHSQRRQRFICAGCKGVTSRFKWMVAGARTILAGVVCCLTTHIFSRLTGKLHAECCTAASLHNLSCPSSLPPQPKPQNVNCSALESMQTSCRTVYKMISLPGINIFSLHFPGWNHYLTFWMLLHLKGFSTAYWESHDLFWI